MDSKKWVKLKKNCPSRISTLGDYYICGAKAIDEFPEDKQECKYQKNCPFLYWINNQLI